MDMFSGSRDMADILNRWGAIGIATAPLGMAMIARMIFGKSKIVTATVRISAGWLAVVFLSPHIDQMHQTLTALINLAHGNGFQ
jgi:hypothetical protein